MLIESMQLVIDISTLQSKLLKRVDAQLSIHGISFTEFMVMHHLSLAPGCTMRRIELAESVGLTASGVTRLLLPMEKINLVQKEINARDARVSLVKLSETGKNLLDDALVGFEDCCETIMKPIGGKQVSQLLKLIEKL